MRKLHEDIFLIAIKITNAQMNWLSSHGTRKRSEVIRELIQAAMENDEDDSWTP